jgi:hypothetical protein
LLQSARDSNVVLEACFSNGVTGALLYAANLPPNFFDLSSGEAGEILQKFRTYGIRLVVVASAAQFTRRFAELMSEENRANDFHVAATADEARDWLVNYRL